MAQQSLSTILTRITESPITQTALSTALTAKEVTRKLIKSTGKAAWIAGTTMVILVAPLIFEVEKDAQLADLELQQNALLGGSSSAFAPQ